MKPMNDKEVEAEIHRLQTEIERWVKSQDLWHDCGFHNFIDYCDAEPWQDSPVATIFTSVGDFNRVFDGSESTDKLYEGFTSLLERLGYWYERDTGRVYLYSVNPIINESFKKYFQWQWVCSLIKPDFNDVYHEMFEYLHRYPERMSKLDWRKYEILIYEILRSQGFNVELGPGRGDGGIDIKMFQRDPIGDVLTAVQVKRYRPDRKITLQAVQALYGAATANDIQNSVFVTTSDYSPSAKKFAARENVSMKLYTSSDVRKWCNQAREGVIKNKALLISRRSVEKILDAAKKTLDNMSCMHVQE